MTQEGLNLIISHEGFSSKAYWDSTGKKWTIGYGTTIYPNGQPVRKGDTITREKAASVLNDTISKTVVPAVTRMVTTKLNQYQLDALTSFAYNCGTGNLKKSTLLQMVNSNPNNPGIRDEFMKWNRSGGQVLKGLTTRRTAEANLYFTGHRPSISNQGMQNLSNDFKQNYGNSQALLQYKDKQQKIQAARADLSNQFRQTYNNSPIVARFAETQRMKRDMQPNLSNDFRQNYGNSDSLVRNARKNGQNKQVFEEAVGKAVSKAINEYIRRLPQHNNRS